MTRRIMTALGAFALAGAAAAATVKSGTLTVELAEDAQGAVARLVTAHGADLAPATDRMPLFYLKATRADDVAKSVEISAADVATCRVEPAADGVRLVHGEAGGACPHVGARHGDVRPLGLPQVSRRQVSPFRPHERNAAGRQIALSANGLCGR